jgi:L-fucose isomerase-like protein
LDPPRVLFWPVGNPDLEDAVGDAKQAFKNLSQAGLELTEIEKMTWWTPAEIPGIARSVAGKKFDAVVVFSATHGTVRCTTAIGQRYKLPLVIWAIPSRYSLATSGLAASYLKERGHWVELLCNEPNDSEVKTRIEKVARTARALAQSKTSKIGIIGKRSPLMISLPYDLELLKRRLGPTTYEIGITILEKELRSVKESEIREKVNDYRQKYEVTVSDSILEKAIRFELAVRRIVAKRGLEGIALECWTNLFPKYGVNPCLGHLDDLTVGCEGDIVSMTGSLILKGINGVNPYLADILGVDAKRNLVTLSHCSAPISLARDASKLKIVERTDPKSRGNTAFAHFDFKASPVTLVRFYGKRLDSIHMIAGELKSTGDYWGGIQLEVAPFGDAEAFLSNISGNHYLVTYGDLRPELRLFAEWKKLQVLEN